MDVGSIHPPGWASESKFFSDHDRAVLAARGIPIEYAAASGLFTEPDGRYCGHRLNWTGSGKAVGPTLTIPFRDLDGDAMTFRDQRYRVHRYFRVRPEVPYTPKPKKDKPGAKPAKYLSPVGSKPRLYFDPQKAAEYRTRKALIVAESELKALAANANGFLAVGLSGVNSWSKADRKKAATGQKVGPRELLDDFKPLRVRGRVIWIIFDSDIATNEQVRAEANALAARLRLAGAKVTIITLPAEANGDKQGLDDFLATNGPAGLRSLFDEQYQGDEQQPTEQPEVLDSDQPADQPGDDPAPDVKDEPKPTTEKKRKKPPPETAVAPEGVPAVIVGADQYRVNAEALDALAKNDATLYSRGGSLVQILDQPADSAETDVIRRTAGAPVIRQLPLPTLREKLSEFVFFVQMKKAGDTEYAVHVAPPESCSSALHARGTWPAVRNLTAIVNHPVMLPDGSILATDGYDPGTGLMVRLDPAMKLDVPDKPTPAEVAAAVATLLDPIGDFPFATANDRAAMVAGILTPLAWLMFDGPAPLFAIDKNVRAAGAGLLADVAGITLTGRKFPVMCYAHKSEEMRKRITTLAVAGERMALIDNIDGTFGSDALDAALTSTTWRDRILGGNEEYNGPLEVCWWATGNNIQFRGDTSRRVCRIGLLSEEEKPERRVDVTYKDLRGRVRSVRSELLSAALTILRNWVTRGRPTHDLPAWGSYEGWSGVVRESLVAAGLPDPAATRDAMQDEADRPAAAVKEIIRLWPNLRPTGAGLSAAEVVAKVKAEVGLDLPAPWAHEMRDAIEELCGKLCGQSLGYKFRSFQKRNFGGCKIVKAGAEDRTGSNRWTVTTVARKEQSAGDEKPSPATDDCRKSECDEPLTETADPRAGDAGDEGGGRREPQKASTRRRMDPPTDADWRGGGL